MTLDFGSSFLKNRIHLTYLEKKDYPSVILLDDFWDSPYRLPVKIMTILSHQ